MTDDRRPAGSTLSWGRGHVRHARVPEWLLLADVSDRAVRLYATLATFADEGGRSFPFQKTLRVRLRCGETALRTALAELQEAGALDVEPRFRDDGSRAQNDYVLHWDSPRADGVPPSPERGGEPREDEDLTRARSSSKDLEKGGDLETSSELALREGGGEIDADTIQIEKPPKLAKIRERDLAFDTLAEVAGVDLSGNRAREVGIAMSGSPRSGLARGIRELVWAELARTDRVAFASDPERWEAYLADRIRIQADLYRRTLGVRLTPLALAKWWTDLRQPAPAGIALRYGRGLTTRQIADLADSGDLDAAVNRLHEGRIFDAD